MTAAERVKMHGEPNNLIELIKADEAFGLAPDEIDRLMDPKAFTGCAAAQTQDFIEQYVQPVLAHYADKLGAQGEVNGYKCAEFSSQLKNSLDGLQSFSPAGQWEK